MSVYQSSVILMSFRQICGGYANRALVELDVSELFVINLLLHTTTCSRPASGILFCRTTISNGPPHEGLLPICIGFGRSISILQQNLILAGRGLHFVSCLRLA